MFYGNAWIDYKFEQVTFIKAKECDFVKANFNQVLQADDPDKVAISSIGEMYMKHRLGGDDDEYGKHYWGECDSQERGASLHYYAKIGYRK
jgi:hypothetical protein